MVRICPILLCKCLFYCIICAYGWHGGAVVSIVSSKVQGVIPGSTGGLSVLSLNALPVRVRVSSCNPKTCGLGQIACRCEHECEWMSFSVKHLLQPTHTN